MSDWQAALGFALVGSRLGLAEAGRPDASLLLSELAAQGWDQAAIAAHARAVVAAGEVWPHPVPTDLRAGLAPAQFAAALGQLRAALELSTLVMAPPSNRTALDSEERRLLREVPPHHVG